MVLLAALFLGLLAGLLSAGLQKRPYQVPLLTSTWLGIIAFIPQLVAFYLPFTRARIPDGAAAICLVASQIMLLVFAWQNRRLNGMWMLIGGLVLNLAVISANGGLMPISPQTAAHLVPPDIVQTLPLGERFGAGKDILLPAEQIRLAWLSDCLLLPAWIHHQVAFSFGDILIACGIFWFLAFPGTLSSHPKRSNENVTNPNNPSPNLLSRNPNNSEQ